MDVLSALRSRVSTRAFSSRPIDDAVLRDLVDDARQAPSWSNTQPYLIGLKNGADADVLRAALVEASQTRIPSPELPQLFSYPEPLASRRRATGYGLYDVLGIDKKDMEGRAAQFERNHRFFDAPAVAFFFSHKALGEYGVLDTGCALMAFLMGATARGVQTCAQAVLAAYPDVVRAHFDVGAVGDYALVCGVAVGYATDHNDAPENAFRPARAPIDDLIAAGRTEPARG
jgi:nitroreductase